MPELVDPRQHKNSGSATRLGPLPAETYFTVGETVSGPYVECAEPWHDTARTLATHAEGPKAGSCYIAGLFERESGEIHRRQEYLNGCHSWLGDSDSGTTPDEGAQAAKGRGIAAVIYTTANHMSPLSEVAATVYDGWLANNPGGTPERFLIEVKHKRPEIAHGAVITRQDREGKPVVTFKHQPCPKFRMIVPYSEIWSPPEGLGLEAAVLDYRERHAAIAAWIGLDCDPAVASPQSLVFLARHAPGAPFHSEIIDGQALNPWAFTNATHDTVAPSAVNTTKPGTDKTFGDIAKGKPHIEATDPKTGATVDLTVWKVKHPKRFKMATAMQRYCGDMISDKSKPGTKDRSEMWFCTCPNAAAHTKHPHHGDTSTTVFDACLSQDFGFDCKHQCAGSGEGAGHDNLVYLKMLIEAHHFPIAALTDDQFLLPLLDAAVNKGKWLFGGNMLPVLFDRPPEIVEGFIGVGTKTIISGDTGTGKSAILSTVAFALVSGAADWMGLSVRRAKVAILAGEGAHRTIHDFAANCTMHGRDVASVMNEGFGIHQGALPLNTPAGGAAALAWVEGFKAHFGAYPDVLIIDTARKNMRGSVNDDADVAGYYETADLFMGMGISVVTAAHVAKGGGSSTKGSSDWEQGADYVVHVTGKVRSGKTRVHFEKNKGGKDGHFFEVNYAFPEVPGAGTTPVPMLSKASSTDADVTAGAAPTDATEVVWVASAKRLLDAHIGLAMPATELATQVMAYDLPELDHEQEREKYTKIRKNVAQTLARAFAKNPELKPYVAAWTEGGAVSKFHNPAGGRRAIRSDRAARTENRGTIH